MFGQLFHGGQYQIDRLDLDDFAGEAAADALAGDDALWNDRALIVAVRDAADIGVCGAAVTVFVRIGLRRIPGAGDCQILACGLRAKPCKRSAVASRILSGTKTERRALH